MNKNNFSQVLKSLTIDGIFSMAKIEWWLLKYHNEYKKIKKEESKRFMYLIDGKYLKLPDYVNIKTPEEKFLKTYDNLIRVSDYHRNENYFRDEMAIYKSIENNSEKVIGWLSKNEDLWLNQYFEFSLDYFGDEDEKDSQINLQLDIKFSNDKFVFVDRNDFINTLMFTSTFNNIYWQLLEDLNLEGLN